MIAPSTVNVNQSTQRTISLPLTLIIALLFGLGGFVFGKSTHTSQTEPTIAPSPIPTSASPYSDSTANWKTYSNQEHGFSIKYPPEWTLSNQGSPNNSWVSISSPDRAGEDVHEPIIGMNTSIQVHEYNHDITENDLINQETLTGIPRNYKVERISEMNTRLNGALVYKYEYRGTQDGYLFNFWGMNIAHDQNIISIHLVDFKEDDSLNTQTLASQILSTFEFIDKEQETGAFCGGIAGIQCPDGFTCELDGDYADAGGICIRN